jgi:hypothetical protein
MAPLEEQLIAIYVFVDDFLQAHPHQAHWRRSPNGTPRFSDAEVLTIALMQGVFGVATLKQTYRLVRRTFAPAFPRLPSYAQWLARLHALSPLVGRLIQAAQRPQETQLYLMDSKPIPLCKPSRHGRVRLLREEGSAFGKNSTGWFFGFKLHALVHESGTVLCALLSGGDWNDRACGLALGWASNGGIVLADLGYRSAPLRQELAEEADLLLLTPADATGAQRRLLSSVRQRIETSFSELWSRFIDRVFSRSFEGLWSTIKLKLLHYNLCHAGLIPS